ncbi:MAG TPA: hypothetical protein VF659_09415 [Pyrinomonadaceae bacterium]|jgi:hypothetical protein
MPLINAAKFREYFKINADIKDSRLTPHIGAAARRLKKWVGDAVYADAVAEAPQDADRAEDLKNAEAALAMHFAMLGLNTELTLSGVLKSRKEVGSQNANIQTTYLTPAEVRQLSQGYLELAEEIARPYALADGTPEAEVVVVLG